MKGKHIKLTLVTIDGMVLKGILSQDPDEIRGISDRGGFSLFWIRKKSLCVNSMDVSELQWLRLSGQSFSH
jgi:hypothetical protein